jgi:hypothetical protein
MVPAGPSDRRTPTQRRADALIEIARLALRSGELPDTGGGRPRLTIVTAPRAVSPSADVLRGEVVGTGTELTPSALLRLACDADIEVAIPGDSGDALDLRRTRREPSPAQRRALVLRDRGCVFPGCDRPPQWTEAHHLVYWSRGGNTDLDNLVLLCAFHHHLLHEGSWTLQPAADGGWTATAPDGRQFHRKRKPAA